MQQRAPSLNVLKAWFSDKLSAMEGAARQRLLLNGCAEPHLHRIAVIRKALELAQNERAVWELLDPINKLEKDLLRPPSPGLAVRRAGISRADTARALPFFDYILKEELPEEFVPLALEYREQVEYFGWKLFVDEGVVVARDGGGRPLFVGHLTWSLPHADAYWKGERAWRGRWSGLAYCCAIAMDDRQLGVGPGQTKAFAYARLAGADDWTQMLLRQMESRFRFCGFALELNEDRARLHLHYAAAEGTRLRATFDGKRLEVPPQAWQNL
ncbi:MAG: hypothetical protein KGH63_00195 [Candidatus Micrarchaeota archaeon]|nr:hypothetical protein [Candidatus Micrarchaeota archaeon]